MYWLLFKKKKQPLKNKWTKQKNAAHWESAYSVFGVCVFVGVFGVCVFVCVRLKGTWVYSSVSTALVVVNMGSFVSDWLQWLCEQFLWPIFATL